MTAGSILAAYMIYNDFNSIYVMLFAVCTSSSYAYWSCYKTLSVVAKELEVLGIIKESDESSKQNE
jgi:hypothetical protein